MGSVAGQGRTLAEKSEPGWRALAACGPEPMPMAVGMSLRDCCSVVALIVPLLAVGCNGEPKPKQDLPSAAPQCPPGRARGADGGCVAPAAAAPPPSVTSGSGLPGAPAPVSPASSSLRPCVALDATAAAAAARLLVPLRERYAPAGAKPIGASAAGQCPAGHALQVSLKLRPGYCYTVVGIGLPPVQDLDLQLVSPDPVHRPRAGRIVAEDQADAAVAVLGGQPDCLLWRPSVAGPVRLIVKPDRGEGVVAAQLYAVGRH
jgi:hypothetical protein